MTEDEYKLLKVFYEYKAIAWSKLRDVHIAEHEITPQDLGAVLQRLIDLRLVETLPKNNGNDRISKITVAGETKAKNSFMDSNAIIDYNPKILNKIVEFFLQHAYWSTVRQISKAIGESESDVAGHANYLYNHFSDNINRETREIISDILSLVDSDPLNNVDIRGVLLKHANDQALDTKSSQRGTIIAILMDLKRNGEIDFEERGISNLATSFGGVITTNNYIIRSTMKRQKEFEAKKEQQKNTFHVHGNNNNFSGVNVGSGNQDLELKPIINPPIQPTKEANNSAKKTWFGKLGSMVINNIGKILLAVIGGLIVAYIKFYLNW